MRVPTFRSSCSTSAPTFHELRKVMGTRKLMIPVPPFHLKFLDGVCRLYCRNFKWAALAGVPPANSFLAEAIEPDDFGALGGLGRLFFLCYLRRGGQSG